MNWESPIASGGQKLGIHLTTDNCLFLMWAQGTTLDLLDVLWNTPFRPDVGRGAAAMSCSASQVRALDLNSYRRLSQNRVELAA